MTTIKSTAALPLAILVFGCTSQSENRGALREHLKVDNEITYVFRSFPSPDVDPTECCAGAPFQATTAQGFDLSSIVTSASDGQVVNQRILDVGTARACTAFNPANIAADAAAQICFDLSGLQFTAVGVCKPTVLAHNVGMTTCALAVIDGPYPGQVSTNTIANIFNVPNYANGSIASVRFLP